MTFTEIDIAGVMVSPVAVVSVLCWFAIALVRSILNRMGVLGRVWHPALFTFSLYLMLLSTIMYFQADPR